MLSGALQWMDRKSTGLPAWMLMVSGVAMLTMALLTPAWLEARQLNWQRRVMRMQLDRLQEKAIRYQEYLEALEADDPIVLERLALSQLHLKPVGVEPIAYTSPHTDSLKWVIAGDMDETTLTAACLNQVLNDPDAGNVDRLLDASVGPTVVEPAAPSMTPNRRLFRLAGGPTRLALGAAGVLCLAASMVNPSSSRVAG